MSTSDPELERLLAEEEALERQFAEQAKVMQAEVRLPGSKYTMTVESLVRDYQRGWDAVKAQQTRLDKQAEELSSLRSKVTKLKYRLRKEQAAHLKTHLHWEAQIRAESEYLW